MSTATSTPATAARPRPQIQAPGSIPVVRLGTSRAGFGDVYHRILTMPWSAFLVLIVASQLVANATFTLLYAAQPGDVTHVAGLVDIFFFSVQTWATIGYGGMEPTTTWANALVVAESITSVVFTAVTTGLVFAKFARPTSRVLFSNAAVITRRDGKDVLMIRVANERGNDVVEAGARLTLMREEVSVEGERMRRLYDLPLVRDVQPVFFVSWTIMHEIDERSPLWGKSQADVLEGGWLLIFNLTGHDGTLAQTIHATHYYTAEQIHFGSRYVDVLSPQPDGRLAIDLRKFHDFEPQSLPIPSSLA